MIFRDSGIGKAIIIAGGGAHKQNTLFKYSTEQCQQMYGFLKQRGYADADIYYMTLQNWQDINGDGRDDNVVDYQLFALHQSLCRYFPKRLRVWNQEISLFYIFMVMQDKTI